MSQYYYWLIPDEPHRSKLQQIIHRFSKIYQSPVFAPHITIGTGNKIIPFVKSPTIPNIRFECVTTEHSYFRSLYFKCETSTPLLSLWKQFGGTEPFVPHLSLIYGSFSQARERDWCSNTPLYEPSVPCSTIWVIRGSKRVQDWRKVESFSIQ